MQVLWKRNNKRYLENAFLLTFEPCESQVLPPPALDELDPVDDDGPPQDVRQRKDVHLLQRRARLRRQAQQPGPVLRQLGVVQAVVQRQGLLGLPVLPPGVEPGREHRRGREIHCPKSWKETGLQRALDAEETF